MSLHPTNGPVMDGPPPPPPPPPQPQPRPMHMAYPVDFKIFMMNKRLQERVDESDNSWWDSFVGEFFDDKATYTISFFLDGQKHYTLGRILIPRFFRTMFESGVVDMNFLTRVTKEYPNAATNSIVMDSEHTTMVMHHTKPMHTKVCAEGHLLVEFNADELMLIRSWHFSIKSHLEYIPKQMPVSHPTMLDDMCKNITRQGLTPPMLNYLKLCFILEPMKELMSRHKTYQMEPHECLKNCLFQKWQRITASTDSSRTNKRTNQRRRKNSNNTGGQANSKKKGFNSDVMMVGEPTLMESFGEDDERTITRHENDQFSAAAAPTHVKSEENENNNNFSAMSSPAPGQWQQQQPANQINSGSVKSEPQDVANNTTSPLVSTT